jgi:hypothetical protein
MPISNVPNEHELGEQHPLGRTLDAGVIKCADSEVGQTIWSQIPISWKMFHGVHDQMFTENGIQFSVKLKVNQRHRFVITYNSMDLYDIELWNITGRRTDRLDGVSNIYFDQLADVMDSMARPYSE